MEKVTYQMVKDSEEINMYLSQGNATLGVMGFTEHSQRHAAKVAQTCSQILTELGYGQHEIELAKIAGYMHDIGNCVNRSGHAHSGAILARSILKDMGMDFKDIAVIMTAIGFHDESSSGGAVNPVSAALVLADKTDVRRNRVRNQVKATFDKHDRVNYAVIASELKIEKEERVIRFNIELDEDISSIMDYFEIFMKRMLMCRRAAEVLGLNFKMTANGNKIC